MSNDTPNEMPHRFTEMFNLTPLWDKYLALAGFTAAGISFTNINAILTTLVTVSTLAMIIPRAIMNWEERAEKRARRQKEREKLAKLEEIVKDFDVEV